MATSSWLVGFAAFAGIALSGCLPDEEAASASAPAEGNSAPTINGIPGTTAVAGSLYNFQAAAADVDGDALVFGASGLPSWASINAQTGLLQGTPAERDVGMSAAITITASDGASSAALPPFTISVASAMPPPPPPPTNTPPTISGVPAAEVEANASYVFMPAAADGETPGDALSFSIANKPDWATFSAKTGEISGIPTEQHVAEYDNIVISVSDGALTSSLSAFKVRVKPRPNRAPSISGTPATTATAGATYAFQPAASDPEGRTLTFSIGNRPAWAAFNTSTGRLTGTPGSSHVGTTLNIVISVSDGALSTSLPAFSITVAAAPNRSPTISGSPGSSVVAGSLYSFAPAATDPDADPLTWSITGKPAWASFSTSTGKLSGTPGTVHVGTTSGVVISVSDGKVGASLPPFSITVTAAPNRSPVISGTPPVSGLAGSLYNFAPTASDPDGDSLSYSIAGKPSWAAFSTATGALTGTPGTAAIGVYSGITITVTDSRGASASLPPFAITLTAPGPSGSATLSWTQPLQYTDGSPLPSDQLVGYRVYHGTSPGAMNEIIMVNDAASTAYTMNQLAAGTHYFAVTAVTVIGTESEWSEVGSKTIQ
ncbi:MAG: putative Ig domain-containing protein [Pseudomonadota bacterium]|nr:putative Ig domain-containing protein [Pseudomonadota bacterium]